VREVLYIIDFKSNKITIIAIIFKMAKEYVSIKNIGLKKY